MRQGARLVRRCSSHAAAAAAPAAPTARPDPEWMERDREDEMGRPLDCPKGLSDEIASGPSYWEKRVAQNPYLSTRDTPGRQAVPKQRAEGAPLFTTVPAGGNPLRLDDTLCNHLSLDNVNTDEIVVPVYNLEKEAVASRRLDPYIFGKPPESDMMRQGWAYDILRLQGYGGYRWLHRKYVPGTQGMVHPRRRMPGSPKRWTKNYRNHASLGGGESKTSSDLMDRRRDVPAMSQSRFLRMALTLKLWRERLIVVEDFNFPTASVDLMRDWANSWGFDRDRMMAYIVDGGSAAAPSQEMNRNVYWPNIFTYGIQVQEPRSINATDVNRYQYLVLTEGALVQLTEFFNIEKAAALPPHLKKRVEVPLDDLGENEPDWKTLEEEAALEMAKVEDEQLEGVRTLHDPWLNGRKWDLNEARIKAHRSAVADHLPRIGEPVTTDVQEFWAGQGVRVPSGTNEVKPPEVMIPRKMNRW